MKHKTHTTNTNFFRKLVFTCFLALTLGLPAFSQTIQWAKTTSSGYANVNDVITDASGNTYVLGDFSGTVNLGNSFSFTSWGSFDGYLYKRDAGGTILWATQIAKGLNEERVRGMAMDASGNIYVCGDFVGTATFGSTNFTSNSSSRDKVILKIDASFGGVSWAKSNGGPGDEYVRDIAVSADGSWAYFTGDFSGVGNVNGNLTSNGFSDIYVGSITSSGIFGLSTRFGGSGDDQGNALTIDASNNIYLTGSIGALTVFGTYSLTPSAKDIFIVKLPATNLSDVTWANKYGNSGNDYGYDITLDAGSSAYATGSFESSVSFGTQNVSSAGSSDMFVVKMNTSGVPQWAKSGGGIADDVGNKIAVNTATDVVVSGTIRTSASFGGISVGNAGSYDPFITKLSPAGVFRWAISGGGAGNDFGTAVALNSTAVFAGGGYNMAASFGSFNLSGNNNEAYLLKIALCTPTTKTITATACASYAANSQTYTATGVYTQTLTNSKGCDSLLTLNLTINQPTSRSISQTTCSSYALNSQTYTSSGVYTQTLTNSKGCDSLLTLNLTINQPTSGSITQTTCGSYVVNSQTYTATGVYTQTLTNSKGCDSLLTLNLTINQPSSRNMSQSACNSYVLNAQTYTLSGVYTQTLTNSKGCDSLLTLNLTINHPTSRSITQTACSSYAANSQTYTSSGVYTQTLTNSKGCDSLLTINLTINQPTSGSLTQTVCGNYAINSQTFTTSGVYTQTLTNSKGCDSLLTLNLTINQPTSRSIAQVACSSYALNSQVYTASGVYTQTLTNSKGCDSLLTLNLTINQPSSASLTQTVCGNYAINSQTFTTSGVYTQTLTNSKGCDSLLTLNLTINQPTSISLTESACDSYTLNSQVYNTSGTYTQTLTNIAGCDSTITLQLTITAIDNSVTQNGLNLTANESGASYQWLDCDNANQPIGGATGQNYTATANGNYAVSITKNGCTKVSTCTNISSVGINERLDQASFRVYPNPTAGRFNISSSLPLTGQSLRVYDVSGRLVLSTEIKETSQQFDLSGYSNGLYLLELEQNGTLTRIRLIKN